MVGPSCPRIVSAQYGVFLAQRIDQEAQVLLVAVEVGGVVAVLAALPPEETGNSLLRRAGVVGADLCEDFLGVGGVVVVLLAGVPLDAFGFGVLLPFLGRLLITRIDHGPDFVGLVVFFFDFPGIKLPNISLRPSGSIPDDPAKISNMAAEDFSSVSTVTLRSSSAPSRSIVLNFSRVDSRGPEPLPSS